MRKAYVLIALDKAGTA